MPSARFWFRTLVLATTVFLSYIYLSPSLTSTPSIKAYLSPIESIYAAATRRHRLLPFTLTPLPPGSITPQGWLRDQLQLMSDGLAGHEYDFYDYVAHSSWLGGDKEYSSLNEGFPYWFNGLVPLAYGLNDERLKQQVHEAAHYVLDHQHEDGWLGPERDSDRLLWARFPLCLGLMQLAQADPSWTRPVVHSLHRFTTLMHEMLADNGTGYVMQKSGDWWYSTFSWGRVRNADMIITLQWLYEFHPANKTAQLKQTMDYLHDYGLKWENWYQKVYFERGMHLDLATLPENDTLPYYHYQHGVNVAQGLKSPAVIRRFLHRDDLLRIAKNAVNWTLQYHGAVSGTIIGDERIGGLSPTSGSELCTSVELMYSLAYLYHATGDSYYADKAEIAAFNSLPAMFTPDYWAHQYVQTANQASAKNYTVSPFYNTNSYSQSFGLEPHYPCCTTNHPQGWPKFASNSFARVGKNGIAHILLSPGKVETTIDSGHISVEALTAYPFADEIEYRIESEAAADLFIRVPAWADSHSSLSIGSNTTIPVSRDRLTSLHKVALQPGSTIVTYRLQTSIRTESRANDTVAIFRGALLYAIEVKALRTSSRPRPWDDQDSTIEQIPSKCKDWQYSNASAWNIAVDPSTAQWHAPKFSKASQLSKPVFDAKANTGYITVQGCKVEWPSLERGVPGPVPIGEERSCIGESFEVRMIPYGRAKLHMAELPVISLQARVQS